MGMITSTFEEMEVAYTSLGGFDQTGMTTLTSVKIGMATSLSDGMATAPFHREMGVITST